MNDRLREVIDEDADGAPPEDRRRILPWVMLSLPFTALLVFVIFILAREGGEGRLGRVEQQEAERRVLYAVRKTPASSVDLLRVAFEKEPGERNEAEAWAIEDLGRRAFLDPDVPAAWTDLRARFLAEWSAESESDE